MAYFPFLAPLISRLERYWGAWLEIFGRFMGFLLGWRHPLAAIIAQWLAMLYSPRSATRPIGRRLGLIPIIATRLNRARDIVSRGGFRNFHKLATA